MTVFISIGSSCVVKYQIDYFKGKIETLFFDWLVTGKMENISKVIGTNDIDTLLNFNTIRLNEQKTDKKYKNSRFFINTLPNCESIHDIPINYTDKDIYEFIDKYKRRWIRLIDYIKSNEKLVFIRCGSINDKDQQIFIETLLKINPKCNFSLVIIGHSEQYTVKKDNRVIYINVPDNLPVGVEKHWTKSHLDWEQIFVDIEKNI